MKARIIISLKAGVLDPQGKAIQTSLHDLDFHTVNNVRQGKCIELNIVEENEELALKNLRRMCEKLLANTVIEDYSIEILD